MDVGYERRSDREGRLRNSRHQPIRHRPVLVIDDHHATRVDVPRHLLSGTHETVSRLRQAVPNASALPILGITRM